MFARAPHTATPGPLILWGVTAQAREGFTDRRPEDDRLRNFAARPNAATAGAVRLFDL